MSNPDFMNQEFARKFPETFARVLARGDPADAADVLEQLPPALAAAVAAKASPRTINTLLESGRGRPDAWLSAASFDDATALLGDLPRELRLALINGVKNRTLRRRLLQFVNYPAHTVGAVVSITMMTFGAEQPIGEVLGELKSQDQDKEVPLVVLDANGRYAGILDVWQLLVREPLAGHVGGYAESLPALRPELPVASAVNAPQWRARGWLPVVDHEGRVLGAVTRQRVLDACESIGRDAFGMQDSILHLSAQLIRVMSDLLGKILSIRTGP